MRFAQSWSYVHQFDRPRLLARPIPGRRALMRIRPVARNKTAAAFLGRHPDVTEPSHGALELDPGKLSIAELEVTNREEVGELERAGVDAVIVPAASVELLVGERTS
jgi:hypothetical protein